MMIKMPDYTNTPPENDDSLVKWMEWYLKSHKVHQFTINGFTYPFVRELNFASLPYPINRKYSMLAGLFSTRKGDLMFFFQSDPQWPSGGIDSRRGLRGIYRVVSDPFADTQPITAPTGYTILGECPACHTPCSNLSTKCINEACRQPYPLFTVTGHDPYPKLNMHLRLDIEPLVVFERAISDERTYADMGDQDMIWIGRHDNQMGQGKGSSVRELLPEEALKLTRLFISEPGQRISRPSKRAYPNQVSQILNLDGTPVNHLELDFRPRAGSYVRKELMLNFDVANTIDRRGSSIQLALGTNFVHADLDYFSSEFPWGYTAGTSDFVCSFSKETGRYRIIVIEFKKGKVDDDAVIQTSLYVPWVTQVLTQFAKPRIEEIEVVPVFIGRKLDSSTCVPKPYSYKPKFVSGASPRVQVKMPIYIEYEPQGIYRNNNGTYYARSIKYADRSASLVGRQIVWTPPSGTVTSQIEKDWVRTTSWSESRKVAGF